MHPSVSLISVKSQDVCRRAAVAAADFTAPLDARAGFLMSRRSCDIVACPLICRRGWHYQSLPLRRRFEHAASVQTDGSQFAVVFTCPPCLFCLCCQCPHVVWIGLWKEQADGTEQALNLSALISFYGCICARWLFYIFCFRHLMNTHSDFRKGFKISIQFISVIWVVCSWKEIDWHMLQWQDGSLTHRKHRNTSNSAMEDFCRLQRWLNHADTEKYSHYFHSNDTILLGETYLAPADVLTINQLCMLI